jgi:uncharacterized protein YkwD
MRRSCPRRIRGALAAGAFVLTTPLGGCADAEEVDSIGFPMEEQAPPPGGAPAPQDAPAGSPAAAEAAIARDLFERLNDERVARDLAPVAWDGRLAALAEEWSATMAETGRFEHRALDVDLFRERLDGFTGVGENIYAASGPLPAGSAHTGWMRSPGHRANLLGDGWERVGIGVTCAPDGRFYATQNFGTAGGRVDIDAENPPPEDPVVRAEADGPSC